MKSGLSLSISVFLFFIILTSESLPSVNPYFIVAKDGSGNFTAVQAAIDALPADTAQSFIILIKNGIYNEKIKIERNNIALIGESRDSTIIVFAELRSNWRLNHADDFGSAVINIKEGTTDITFINLTVHNNYGSVFGNHDHQFAIRGGGNKIIIVDCNIISDGGDTLSLWNGSEGMYFHLNCYFEGYVDYVCPRGWCYIADSKFFGHNLTASIWHDGSKNIDQKFVIRNSRFDGVPGFPLGRHHLDARFYLIDCSFSKNMADKPIYFCGKKPMQWNERDYYFNCHGDSVDYAWHSNNLSSANDSPAPEYITAKWTFGGKWEPEIKLKEIGYVPNSFKTK